MECKGESIRNQAGYREAELVLVETIIKVLRERKPYEIKMFLTPRSKLMCKIYVTDSEIREFEVCGETDDGIS